MNDWTKIDCTCPACKSNLKVRVEVDFDAELDLECAGKESREGLFSTRRDDEGKISLPEEGGQKYSPLIPNVAAFDDPYPEGFATIRGERRSVFLVANFFLTDEVPWLHISNPMFEEQKGKDWSEVLCKNIDRPGKWLFVSPSETGNAIVAMRDSDGKVACYAKRNDIDLFNVIASCKSINIFFFFNPEGNMIMVEDSAKRILGGTIIMNTEC